MEILEQLEEYLQYMQQLGFQGLALEESPFNYAPTPPPMPQRARPVRQDQPAMGAPPPPRPDISAPKTAAKPKVEVPNLLSIMETVDSLSPSQDTRALAASVSGNDSMELLKNLYSTFQRCQACALGTTRNRFIFGEGPPNAKLMFVGEYPTQIDDTTGRPFMDQSGQLLTKIIKAMGLSRGDVFITNAVKCAPPARMPLPDELNACAPILERQIEAINPRVIVALGASALRFFKGEGVSLVRAHGQIFDWKQYKVMATYHPSYILRNPRSKRDVWDDLQKVLPLLH